MVLSSLSELHRLSISHRKVHAAQIQPETPTAYPAVEGKMRIWHALGCGNGIL
jgi:hypothetical protein